MAATSHSPPPPKKDVWIDPSSVTVQLAYDGGQLYQRRNNGEIGQYFGLDQRWKRIGEEDKTLMAIAASPKYVYKLYEDGEMSRYKNASWEPVGRMDKVRDMIVGDGNFYFIQTDSEDVYYVAVDDGPCVSYEALTKLHEEAKEQNVANAKQIKNLKQKVKYLATKKCEFERKFLNAVVKIKEVAHGCQDGEIKTQELQAEKRDSTFKMNVGIENLEAMRKEMSADNEMEDHEAQKKPQLKVTVKVLQALNDDAENSLEEHASKSRELVKKFLEEQTSRSWELAKPWNGDTERTMEEKAAKSKEIVQKMRAATALLIEELTVTESKTKAQGLVEAKTKLETTEAVLTKYKEDNGGNETIIVGWLENVVEALSMKVKCQEEILGVLQKVRAETEHD